MGSQLAKISGAFPDEQLYGVHKAVYLGSTPIDSFDAAHGQTSATKATRYIEDLGEIPRKVWVGVSSKAIRVLGRVTKDIMQTTDILDVIFCHLLQTDSTRFVYVVKDRSGITTCHSFTIKEPARTLPKVVSEAFAFAQREMETAEEKPATNETAENLEEDVKTGAVLGSFSSRFLGSVPVDKPSGGDVVARAVQQVRVNLSSSSPTKRGFLKKRTLAGEAVILSVSSEGVRAVDCLSGEELHNVFIKNISYTAATKVERKKELFAFIARDDRLEIVMCYVFDVVGLTGRKICTLIGAAMKQYAIEYKGTNAFLPQSGKVPEDQPDSLKDYFVDRENLSALKVIGTGHFGKVYLADEMQGEQAITRAVKLLRGGASKASKVEFLHEMEVMAKLKHENIITLVGVSCLQRPWLAVLEFMQYGDLRKALQAAAAKKIPLRLTEQYNFCRQIAVGMKFIAEAGFVHMDLALRNVLLHHNSCIKISDFGVSRPIDPKTGAFQLKAGLKLSVKWLAPDAVESKLFSEKTDVWAFGIAMWEVFSYGQWPYKGVPNTEILRRVRDGLRLQKPHFCSEEFFQVMKACWHAEQQKRWTFAPLVDLITKFQEEAQAKDPPIRDFGALINGKLTESVRRLSVAGTIRRQSISMARRGIKKTPVIVEENDVRLPADVIEEEEIVKEIENYNSTKLKNENDTSDLEVPEGVRLRLNSVSTTDPKLARIKLLASQSAEAKESSTDTMKDDGSPINSRAYKEDEHDGPEDPGKDDTSNDEGAEDKEEQQERHNMSLQSDMSDAEDYHPDALTSALDSSTETLDASIFGSPRKQSLILGNADDLASETAADSPRKQSFTIGSHLEDIAEISSGDSENEDDNGEPTADVVNNEDIEEADKKDDEPSEPLQPIVVADIEERRGSVSSVRRSSFSKRIDARLSSKAAPRVEASEIEETKKDDKEKETKDVEKYQTLEPRRGSTGPFARPATQHSKIFEALNPQPLYYESAREKAEREAKAKVVSGSAVGIRNYSQIAGVAFEDDEELTGMDDAYFGSEDSSGEEMDDNDDDDDEDFDPNNLEALPGFEEFEALINGNRQQRAKEEEERRAELRRSHLERKNTEQKLMEEELARIAAKTAKEKEELEAQKYAALEDATKRLSELKFDFTFATSDA